MFNFPHFPTVCLLLISLLTSANVHAQEGWKGIIPLKTTREEVEKKLGKPGQYGRYEMEEGRVSFYYSIGNCDKVIACHCLVPIGTVLGIRVNLYSDLFLKDLKLDPKYFKKHRDHYQVETYANRKTGVVYEVHEGKVSYISYYESEKNCNEIERNASKKVKPN